MGNVTTPIKGALAAYLSHLLVAKLGMEDGQASYVADAAWLLLTAALAYAIPADFGGKTAGAVVSWILARVLKVAPVLVAVSIGGAMLTGCSAQQAGPPLTPEQAQAKAERRCEWAETLASSGRLAAVLALQNSDDADVKLGVAVALAGVDAAVADYCDAVRAGTGADAEKAALAGLRGALDDLTERTLTTS